MLYNFAILHPLLLRASAPSWELKERSLPPLALDLSVCDGIFQMPPPPLQIYSPPFSTLFCVPGSSSPTRDHWQETEGGRRIRFANFFQFIVVCVFPWDSELTVPALSTVGGVKNLLQGSSNFTCRSHPAHCVCVELCAKNGFYIFLKIEKIEKQNNIE